MSALRAELRRWLVLFETQRSLDDRARGQQEAFFHINQWLRHLTAEARRGR